MIFSLLLTAASLPAQGGQPKLEIEIRERKMNLTEAEKNGADIVYTPGDTIEYTVIAKNTGDGIMTKPSIVDPIPQGVEYIEDSARGENCRIVFSVNYGLRYSVWPVMVMATTESGAKIEQPAKTDKITHIKWLVQENIPAGGEKRLLFQVVVK